MSQGVKPSGQGLQRLLKALGTRAFREKKKGTADTVRSPAETGYYYSGANQLSTLTLPIALSILGAGLEDQQTAYLEAAGAECLEPKRIWSDAECMQEIVGL